MLPPHWKLKDGVGQAERGAKAEPMGTGKGGRGDQRECQTEEDQGRGGLCGRGGGFFRHSRDQIGGEPQTTMGLLYYTHSYHLCMRGFELAIKGTLGQLFEWPKRSSFALSTKEF